MRANNLEVFLNDRLVGNLTQLIDGTTVLAFDEKYVNDNNRPTLSLSYKNVLSDIQSSAKRPVVGLPPFFSNLLPEGELRKYLAQKAGVKESQEYRLLLALKDDLPGAVILKSAADIGFDEHYGDQHPLITDEVLRFSLAGVQLKFSADLRDSKIVIPANGIGGHWIVKFPSPAFPNVINLEYAMLLLASNIGINVPDFKLIPSTDIKNLPHDIPETYEGNCLISRRFDRTADGHRIHMEDFAQVFAIRDKYDPAYNYQSIASVLWIEIGLDAVLEFVRRLVHMIAIGNADMHLKNWSLIYPNGRQAALSPAYDFVSTIVYKGIDKHLALKMAGIREFSEINLDTFKRFSQIAKLPERAVINTVIETVNAIKTVWPKLKKDIDIPISFKHSIEEHMQKMPIFYENE